MLLPYILTNGALYYDDLGIIESGNGNPDIIDEARDEVDFFLRLRHGKAYSHGLTNPHNNIMYQAGHTAISAWVNAVNSAMLAESFRISGHNNLMRVYTDSAIVAFNYASNLDNQMLSTRHNIGEGWISGQDLKMTAAAFLYNLTKDTTYENSMKDNCIITGPSSSVLNYNSGNQAASHNQLYGIVAYMTTPHKVNFPELQNNMRSSIIQQAIIREANYSNTRPSRRATDNSMGYFQTIQNVHRSIVAHRFAEEQAIREQLYNAITLEADWGLGRNPLNIIQMTTATTPLAEKRSIQNCYTSGRNDGTPGLHPGHTPYLNMDCWSSNMVMSCPPKLHEFSYPAGVNNWPRAEMYFSTRFVWAHSEFTPQQTMRGKAALYGYLYGSSSAGIPQPEPGDPSDPFHSYYSVVGRSDLSKPEGPVLFYAGSYIKVRFQGTSAEATFTDHGSFHSQGIGFIINNRTPIYHTLPENSTQTFSIATGLEDDIHELIIFKMNNPGGNSFGLQFHGLILDNDKGILPADSHYNLSLEFYGNSFTAGSESGAGGEDSGWNSFANVCARILRAEIHNNGIAGLAVMDSTGWYQDKTTGLETTFNKLDPGIYSNDGYSDWDFSRFTPDILVFGFGINDNFGDNNAFDNPENWKSTYKYLIKNLADIHGKDRIRIILHPANIYNQAYTHGPEVVSLLREEGYDAYWFQFSFELDAHPTMEEAQQMGEELAVFIQQMKRSVPVRSVVLNITSMQLSINHTEALEATVLPANTTFSKDVYWTSDDHSIATVDQEGNVTGVSLGTTRISVFTLEGNKTRNCYVTVTPATNVHLTDQKPIEIFPNPLTTKQLKIDLRSLSGNTYAIRIYCIKGKLHHESFIQAKSKTISTIHTRLQPGVYFLDIKGENLEVQQKLIVQ